MNFSYLSFTTSDTTPIECKNSSKELLQGHTTEDFVNLVITHQKTKPFENKISDTGIEHWLERKWQVCLDYYLSSMDHGNNNPGPLSPSPVKIDVALPQEKTKEQLTSIEALLNRKTHRKFQDKPLELKVFSQLLMALKEELFPDIWRYYLVAFNVKDIPSGIYRYHAHKHGLTSINEGMLREKAVQLLCGMSASLTASFLIVLSIDIQEALQRYPYNRALREIYIDSGRIAQKMLIKGMQYNIGGLPSPAMRDTSMCTFLDINPGECIPLYSLTMGVIPGKEIL